MRWIFFSFEVRIIDEFGVRFTKRAELYPLLEPLGMSTEGAQAFRAMAMAAVERIDNIFIVRLLGIV